MTFLILFYLSNSRTIFFYLLACENWLDEEKFEISIPMINLKFFSIRYHFDYGNYFSVYYSNVSRTIELVQHFNAWSYFFTYLRSLHQQLGPIWLPNTSWKQCYDKRLDKEKHLIRKRILDTRYRYLVPREIFNGLPSLSASINLQDLLFKASKFHSQQIYT